MSDRAAETRTAIIDAAHRLFAERGFRETTIQQIAAAAHVSVGTIYVYFSGKPGLMLHFVVTGLDALEADIASSRAIPSPIARVHAAGDAYFRFAARHSVAARYAAVRVLDPERSPEFAELNELLSQRVRQIVLGVAEDVQAAMQTGEVPVTPMEDTMVFLWALWNGTAALMLRQDDLAISPRSGQKALEFGRTTLRLADASRGYPRDAASAEPAAAVEPVEPEVPADPPEPAS